MLFAVLGFKGNYWLVVAALIGHGVFDFVRHFFIDNPGVPQWWPGFTDPVGMIWNFSPLITGVALLMAFSRRRLPSLPAPVD